MLAGRPRNPDSSGETLCIENSPQVRAPRAGAREGQRLPPLGSGGGAGAGGAAKVWTISGRLCGRESEIDGERHDRNLEGIEVKISASDLGADGPWEEWGTVRTNANGDFTLRETNNGKTRFFRVQARLVGDDLEVNESKVNETFRRQALIWYVLRTAIDRLQAEDPWFAMNRKIAAIYPAHTLSGLSYANGPERE